LLEEEVEIVGVEALSCLSCGNASGDVFAVMDRWMERAGEDDRGEGGCSISGVAESSERALMERGDAVEGDGRRVDSYCA